MQKWDYLVVECNSDGKVLKINNQDQGKDRNFFGAAYITSIVECLTKMGEDGWEVVARSPTDTGSEGKIFGWTIIAKRPR